MMRSVSIGARRRASLEVRGPFGYSGMIIDDKNVDEEMGPMRCTIEVCQDAFLFTEDGLYKYFLL